MTEKKQVDIKTKHDWIKFIGGFFILMGVIGVSYPGPARIGALFFLVIGIVITLVTWKHNYTTTPAKLSSHNFYAGIVSLIIGIVFAAIGIFTNVLFAGIGIVFAVIGLYYVLRGKKQY